MYSLTGSSDISFVQNSAKEIIATLESDQTDKMPLADLKKTFGINKVELEKSRQKYEDKISEAENHFRGLPLNKDIMKKLETKIERAKSSLTKFEERGQYHEDLVSKSSDVLLAEDPEAERSCVRF